MPRKRSEQPAYQYHISGQAKVRLDQKDFYLGKHGTPESYARYYALLAEYNANGKRSPGGGSDESTHQADDIILVKHITADFRARRLPEYQHNDVRSTRFNHLCDMLDLRHGTEPANEFGPRKLEAMRDIFGTKGLGKNGRANCRRQVNELVRDVITVIEHGVSRELVGPERIVALRSLKPLKKGQGIEHPKRTGVSPAVVKATLPKMTATLAAMIRLQMATAMRPPFKGRCSVITSYNPLARDVTLEETGANTETEKQFIYNTYTKLLNNVESRPAMNKTETYEEDAKSKFISLHSRISG